ncbi:unnamed protein product [Prunus armeniaca]
MHYAPSLEIVSDIGNYNWGSAALACLYRSMDSSSRGRSSSMGGMGLRVPKAVGFSKAQWDLEHMAPCIEMIRCKSKARLAQSVGTL